MRPLLVALTLAVLAPVFDTAPAYGQARLLRQPDVSDRHVVFAHGGDVWIGPRDGGDAHRLTTFVGEESHPHFSPDGSMVAFSGSYDGNVDVYVVPVAGGEPRRLTWHPGEDFVRGWTPDGAKVVFASGRINAPRPWNRLWTIGLDDPMPTALAIDRVDTGEIADDGHWLAYQMVGAWDPEWRNYRGGQTQPIRLVDLHTLDVRKLPWEGTNDLDPVWADGKVFFLSDRDWAMNVWSFDPRTSELVQRTRFTEFDCKELGSGGGRLVFENGGYLYTMPASGGEARRVDFTLRGDFPLARPSWKEVGEAASTVVLSPTGKRALVEARGEIFSVPAEKGDWRNLSNDAGAADRAPSWSPDGRHVAWFSDTRGEYQLVLADAHGNERRTISFEQPSFYYTPTWSPDSKWLACTDADRRIWIVDVQSGRVTSVDEEGSAHPNRSIRPAWSPDSKWITYSRSLDNQFQGVFVYDVAKKQKHAITDGLSDARMPVFDRDGKHLHFLASTNYALNVGWLDMSSYDRPVQHAVYTVVLRKEDPSPVAPESDEETVTDPVPAKDAKKDTKKDAKKDEEPAAVEVRIDFEGLGRRIVALGIPARSYTALSAGESGVLFYTEQTDPQRPGAKLYRYAIADREETEILTGVLSFDLSADGKKIVAGTTGNRWTIFDASGAPTPGEGTLDLSGLRMRVDPAEEWRQIFREGWRFQRDYFYVRNVHGLDLDWAWNAYAPWLEHVRHRNDLNYLLDILGGETAVGHSFNGGGDVPEVASVPIGLLGADLAIERGHYRITRIYDGENWNPQLRAPLSGPGLDVRVGDYVVAVNGQPITAARNFHAFFEGSADKQILLAVNDTPATKDAREFVVVPVESEVGLRQRAWVEDNRRLVDELSGGKLAYVWVPDTGRGGYTSFNRYFYAQMHKQGAIIDERFNHGGSIADYIVDLLDRPHYGYFNNPLGDRKPWTAPNAAIFGPKVMLINEMSGSGGDMLPYMFRARGIGPLVGTRTWGGLVGIWDVPDLIDGGFMTAPRGGFFTTEGEWAVENEGVAPDVEVEMDPKLTAQGRDPQLEAAVRLALDRLEAEGIELLRQPPDPVRSRRPE